MQVKTLLIGTVFLTAGTLFSLNQIPDPVVPKPVHRQIARRAFVRPHHAAHRTAHRLKKAPPLRHPAGIAKHKPSKRKPYFMARA